MPNVKFIELETEIEIEDNHGIIGLFSQIRETLNLGTKQALDLQENFNPIIRIPVYLQINFKTGKIIDFGIESCVDNPNCVTTPTQKDYQRLIGKYNDELEERVKF